MYDKSLFFNVFERSDEFFFLFKKTLSKAKHEYKKNPATASFRLTFLTGLFILLVDINISGTIWQASIYIASEDWSQILTTFLSTVYKRFFLFFLSFIFIFTLSERL